MRIFTVDAFTDAPFSGNPAGVCLLDEARTDSWMAAVAAEMNLAETAFLLAGSGGYDLRWFTPTVEVDLCGHATLASAHVLYELGATGGLAFSTRSGTLRASRARDRIVLDFPARPPALIDAPHGLEQALRCEVHETLANGDFLLARVADAAVVRELVPDIAAIAALGLHGVIVTAAGEPDSGLDMVSRFFAPNFGIPEDPVTGSAHCVLGPYWGERLCKSELVGYQASRRGGTVGVALRGDRVELSGAAVTVLRGELV